MPHRSNGLRQKAKRRLLDRALARIGIGRLQIVGLLVFLRRGGGCKEQDGQQSGSAAHVIRAVGGMVFAQTCSFSAPGNQLAEPRFVQK